MKQKLTVSCEGKPCYDIVLTIGFEACRRGTFGFCTGA